MEQLDNITTPDEYEEAAELVDQFADLLSIDVSTADVYVQLRPYDEDRQNLLDYPAEEMRVVAPTHLLLDSVAGVRVRSARAGTPGLVTAQLFEPDEPRPSAASAAVQVLTTVGQVGVQHNGALQDSENTLDFEDDASIVWTVTPDSGHGRVQVSAAIAASVALTGTPTATTPGTADNSTKIATTAYVQNQQYATLATGATQGFAGAITAKQLGGSSTSAVNVAGGTFVASSSSMRLAGTDGSTVTTITNHAGATLLHVRNASGSSIPFATGGASPDGLQLSFTLGNSSSVWLAYDTVGQIWTPLASNGVALAHNAGDYTAAQVTNAADTSSAAQQVFAANITTLAGSAGSGLTGGTFNVVQTAEFQTFSVTNGGGTVTITNPSANPGAAGTTTIFLKVKVATTATALSWGTAYAFGSIPKPTSVAGGSSKTIGFQWDPDASKWQAVSQS